MRADDFAAGLNITRTEALFTGLEEIGQRDPDTVPVALALTSPPVTTVSTCLAFAPVGGSGRGEAAKCKV